MKKFTALLLTIAMLLTLAVLPASAEGKGTLKLGGPRPVDRQLRRVRQGLPDRLANGD